MRHLILLLGVLVAASFAAPTSSWAQSKKKQKNDEYFNESGSFKNKLWYGGGFNLGFGGVTGTSVFSVGASPMVGYKIIDWVSAGPRLSLTYTNERIQLSNNTVLKGNYVDYGLAGFARIKLLNVMFLHGEYEYASQEFYDGIDPVNNKILTQRLWRDNAYAGVGYNASNGGFGFEIYGLYNFLLPDNVVISPFTIRFGVTYRF